MDTWPEEAFHGDPKVPKIIVRKFRDSGCVLVDMGHKIFAFQAISHYC